MKRSEIIFTLSKIPIDFLALLIAGIGAFYLRLHPLFQTYRPVTFDLTLNEFIKLIIPIALVWLFVFASSGLYSILKKSIATELTRVALACSTSMAIVFAILFFSRVLFQSRFIAIAAWILAIIFVAFGRLLIRALQHFLKRFGIGEKKIIIIGKSRIASYFKFKIIKHFDHFDIEIAEQIREIKKNNGVDEIILIDPDADHKMRLDILSFTDTEQLGFKYTADLFASAIGKSIFHTYAGVPVIEVRKTPLDGWGAIYKRIFDIVGSLFLIIITLPIQIITAVALFIEQPGRILFSRLPNNQKTMRIGQGGKPFHYFKFRSMVKNAHNFRSDPNFIAQYGNLREGTPLFKLEHDPRVTKVGKFIRKFSIDEIPEFYLVLLGRMSLVGPRPHLPEEVNCYTNRQKKVLTLKPGITGMAQVSGRHDLDFNEEVRLDIHYIEHWSPWLDLLILLKTPFVVFKGAV